MSSASPSREFPLARVLTFAGFPAAAILVVNALKRAEILPLSPATQLAAPFAQLLSIALVVGLFAAIPALRTRLGSVGVVLYVASLGGLVGVEYVINLVFPYIDAASVPTALAGPLGVAFTVTSIAFLVGTILFFAALWRVPGSPKVGIIIAIVSTVPIALRMSFPEVVLQAGLVGLALGIVLVTVWAVRSRSRAAVESDSLLARV